MTSRILIVCEPTNQAWGIEARVPFLDRDFIETSLCIDPKIKLKDGIEKHVLSNAFTTDNYLPILRRQKEQFSDGEDTTGLIQSRVLRSIIAEEARKYDP